MRPPRSRCQPPRSERAGAWRRSSVTAMPSFRGSGLPCGGPGGGRPDRDPREGPVGLVAKRDRPRQDRALGSGASAPARAPRRSRRCRRRRSRGGRGRRRPRARRGSRAVVGAGRRSTPAAPAPSTDPAPSRAGAARATPAPTIGSPSGTTRSPSRTPPPAPVSSGWYPLRVTSDVSHSVSWSGSGRTARTASTVSRTSPSRSRWWRSRASPARSCRPEAAVTHGMSKRLAPVGRGLRSGDIGAHEEGVGPEQLAGAPIEAGGRRRSQQLIAALEPRARAALAMVAHVVEVPQHEAAVTEEPVDVAEQRLPLVHAVELDLGLHRDDAVQGAGGAPEDVELRSLRVELDEVDAVHAAAPAPLVERDDLDLLVVGQPLGLETRVAVDDVVERLVERRARRLAGDVDGLRARLPTEALGDDLDPGAVVVTLPQRWRTLLRRARTRWRGNGRRAAPTCRRTPSGSPRRRSRSARRADRSGWTQLLTPRRRTGRGSSRRAAYSRAAAAPERQEGSSEPAIPIRELPLPRRQAEPDGVRPRPHRERRSRAGHRRARRVGSVRRVRGPTPSPRPGTAGTTRTDRSTARDDDGA